MDSPEVQSAPAEIRSKTTFHGLYRTRVGLSAKELSRLQVEILRHLADSDDLELVVEVHARRSNGFSDETIRTVSENAAVLKFERASFDEE